MAAIGKIACKCMLREKWREIADKTAAKSETLLSQ